MIISLVNVQDCWGLGAKHTYPHYNGGTWNTFVIWIIVLSLVTRKKVHTKSDSSPRYVHQAMYGVFHVCQDNPVWVCFLLWEVATQTVRFHRFVPHLPFEGVLAKTVPRLYGTSCFWRHNITGCTEKPRRGTAHSILRSTVATHCLSISCFR